MTPQEVVKHIYKGEETLKELQFYMLKNDVILELDKNNELVWQKQKT